MAGQGLSTDEVQGIREALAAGRKPKVVFTAAAGQMAGQLGQVVELTDPELSEEFVVVRFGRDELPFSPADVAVAPRGAGRKPAEAKPEPPAEPQPATAEPEFVLDTPRLPAPRREEPRVEQQAEAKPAKRAVKAAKPKGPAGLTVTLAYAEGEWTVAAQQGAKALAKPYVVKPAEALRMVALVDVPGVQEAVEQILAAERAEAEQQAEKLRAELAEIEARLAELREAR
ncbi:MULTISPECIES: hypothetical protein [Micromonospora]|uniref:Uncharacterized protein n=1 Tax=Micromonospora solifontis TaxID=2487138 RepID=A0ABX9WMR4_9ACTN|nr:MULTISPECIES: hypothetical protein [Micromonospora]NES13671.1 hypothetical protein [Micromonospora sp. PPF5-17B]NES35480.1 hypothetical protein [Micromonospora solifontis]NES55363.1 hypothetical protein [Micromonospora sp. PPF5-6]RNM00783.1 hypothetical protein EFE23_04795 [Micromonospora solifontis]